MYERYTELLELVYDLQASAEGVTYSDVQKKFNVSRRTAERMMEAIRKSFLEVEKLGGRPVRWRLKRTLATPRLSSEALAVLLAAPQIFRKEGMEAYARQSEHLFHSLQANMLPDQRSRVGTDVDALSEAEGFAYKPGPKETIDEQYLSTLRHAVLACHAVRFEYSPRLRSEDKRVVVYPYGFLHGTREYLVAYDPSQQDYRMYSLSRISNLEMLQHYYFERDEKFSISSFLQDSFGSFRERPYNVVWRFSADVADNIAEWRFHPSQTSRVMRDGRVEVSFRAGGIREMAWHAITWGDKLEVIKPKKLINELRMIRDAISKMCPKENWD